MDLVANAEQMLAKAISKVAISKNTDQGQDNAAATSSSSTSQPPAEGSRVDIYEGPITTTDDNNTQQQPPAPGFKSAFVLPIIASTPSDIQNDRNVRDVSKSGVEYIPGSFWDVSWFQRVFIFTLLRLFTFVRKIFEDYDATKTYYSSSQIYSFVLALASLMLPTLVYTIYRVGRYMQTVIFERQDNDNYAQLANNDISLETTNTAVAGHQSSSSQAKAVTNSNSHDNQSVPVPRLPISVDPNNDSNQIDNEEESGLVTARQSPLEPSVQASTTTDVRIPMSDDDRARPRNVDIIEPYLGSQCDDKQSVSTILGILTHMVHGVMYIFWQVKRQVDLIGFLCERSCVWRKPRDSEQEKFDSLSRQSDGLEFFEDFYAGFLGVLTQVALIVATFGKPNNSGNLQQLSASSQNSLSNTAGQALTGSNSAEGLSISQAARTLTSAINRSDADKTDLLLTSELIVSLLVIASLLAAVRRRDDGYLTFTLSFIGWGSIFASRLIILSLTAVLIRFWIVVPIVCHVAGISYWVYTIALASHNGARSERLATWRMDDMIESKEAHTSRPESSAQLQEPTNLKRFTDQWPLVRHVTLIVQIVALFSIPSLFYWPIMFNMKLHYRLFKYLTLIMSENLVMILLVSFGSWPQYTDQHRFLTAAVAVFSVVGFIFLVLYTMCKPSLTEHFAMNDQLANEAQSSGIYFDFCQRVFKLPDVVHDRQFTRLLDQQEREE